MQRSMNLILGAHTVMWIVVLNGRQPAQIIVGLCCLALQVAYAAWYVWDSRRPPKWVREAMEVNEWDVWEELRGKLTVTYKPKR